MYVRKILIAQLLEAALDQPAPTPEFTLALNAVLRDNEHPDRIVVVGTPR